MRWFILLFALSGFIGLANWSYHQLDNVFLVTNYWEASLPDNGSAIVTFKDGQGVLAYQYQASSSLWPILRTLWPICTLIVLGCFILTPATIYIFRSLYDAQLQRAKKSVLDAKKKMIETQTSAQKDITAAYQKQRSTVCSELKDKSKSLDQLKQSLALREKNITSLEQQAASKQKEAEQALQHYRGEFHQLKNELEEKEKLFTKSRQNAVAAMQRRKMKSNT